MIAVPYRRHLELHLEVDLTLVTISDDNQQEEEKKLKFTGLKLTHSVRSQEREVGEDQVEVNVKMGRDTYLRVRDSVPVLASSSPGGAAPRLPDPISAQACRD